MRRRLGLTSLLVLMLVGILLVLVTALQPAQVGLERVGMSGTKFVSPATLTCTTHTTGMTLTTNSPTLQVGDRLWITATLANEGCGQVGQPEYRLLLEPLSHILVPDSPISATHSVALEPGETDVVTFKLQAIGVGEVVLQASASFEMHLGYPGPAYWAYDSTTPISVSVAVTDTEIVVLQQASYELGCFSDVVQTSAAVYKFGCAVAMGHSMDAQIERFADEETAQTVFAARQGSLLLDLFHGYSAYGWKHEQEAMPKLQAWHSWLAGRLIVTTHSVDDTAIPVAPLPIMISEAIYRTAISNRLVLAHDLIYLPIICRQ